MISILQSPNEILHQIVAEETRGTSAELILGEGTLFNLALTCRRLHEVASPVLWTYASRMTQSRVMTFGALSGNLDILRKALFYGFRVNVAGDETLFEHDFPAIRRTAFGDAVSGGIETSVAWFLDNGVELEAPAYQSAPCFAGSAHGCTPLFLAIQKGQISTTMLLLDRGASPVDVNVKEKDDMDWVWIETTKKTALQEAARYGLTEVCERLVCEYGLNPLDLDANGQDFLTLAAAGDDDPETMLKLIELGSLVEGLHMRNWKHSPLCAALKNANFSNAATLVDLGSSVKGRPNNPWQPFPLQECLQIHNIVYGTPEEYTGRVPQRIQAMTMFLEKGADINGGENEMYGTALRKAVIFEDMASLKFLLQSGAEPNMPSGRENTTPISTALDLCLALPQDTPFEIIKTLLDYGARVDIPNKRGVTVLQRAARCTAVNDRGSYESLQCILDNSTGRNVKQEHLDEVLGLHFQKNRFYTCRTLMKSGARLVPPPDKDKLYAFAGSILLQRGSNHEIQDTDVAEAFHFVARHGLCVQDLNMLLINVLASKKCQEAQLVLEAGAMSHPTDRPLLPSMMSLALECKDMSIFHSLWRIMTDNMEPSLMQTLLPYLLRKAIRRSHRSAAYFLMAEGADPLQLYTPPSIITIPLRDTIKAQLGATKRRYTKDTLEWMDRAEALLPPDDSPDYSPLELACANCDEEVISHILRHYYRIGMPLPRISNVPCAIANSNEMRDLFKVKGLI